MGHKTIVRSSMVAAALVMLGGGFAAADPSDPATTQTTIGEGTPAAALPAPRSDNDPRPPVAAPTIPTTGVTEQAGVGGTQAYGRAGVLELGGSGGFSAASNYSRFELSPSIGLFLMDNVEISLLTRFNYFSVGADNSASRPSTSATELAALIEPSIHIPFSQMAFGFLGLGAGVAYLDSPGAAGEAGFALQPRLGANFLIGRSGVLTPALSLNYSTVEAVNTGVGTVLAVRTTYGLNVGYTVMW